MPSGTPVRARWSAEVLEALLFSCLLDGCLYDDDCPIANLEPGVSGRNSLPLTGTPGPGPLRASRFLALPGPLLDAFFRIFDQ